MPEKECYKTFDIETYYIEICLTISETLYEKVKHDFFAVSLPDFLIFEEDMDAKNKAHCFYLMGLASLGRKEKEKAKEYFNKALVLDYNHQNCCIYKKMTL